MKKKDLPGLRTKAVEELEAMGSDLRGQIARVILELRGHKGKDTNSAKNLKKDLARVLSIIREKRLAKDR